jgi:hypothetical protein
MRLKGNRNGPLTLVGGTACAIDQKPGGVMSDLIYLASGIVVFLLFAGYAALLRRA